MPRVVLTIPDELAPKLIQYYHSYGWGQIHSGYLATLFKLRKDYSIRNLPTLLKEHLENCTLCKLVKRKNNEKFKQVTSRLAEAKSFFQICTIDYITNLPETSRGYKDCMLLIDNYSRLILLFPSPKNDSAKNLLKTIVNFGVMRFLRHDRGSHFQNNTIHNLCQLMNVKSLPILAKSPFSSGIIERKCGLVKENLKKMVTQVGIKDWDLFIPILQYSLNSCVNTDTQMTPFHMAFGNEQDIMSLQLDANLTSLDKNMPYIENLKAQMKFAKDLVNDENAAAADKMNKRYADNKTHEANNIQPGDYLFILNPAISRTVDKGSRAFSSGKYGPVLCTKRHGSAVEVCDMSGTILKDLVHIRNCEKLANPRAEIPADLFEDRNYNEQLKPPKVSVSVQQQLQDMTLQKGIEREKSFLQNQNTHISNINQDHAKTHSVNKIQQETPHNPQSIHDVHDYIQQKGQNHDGPDVPLSQVSDGPQVPISHDMDLFDLTESFCMLEHGIPDDGQKVQVGTLNASHDQNTDNNNSILDTPIIEKIGLKPLIPSKIKAKNPLEACRGQFPTSKSIKHESNMTKLLGNTLTGNDGQSKKAPENNIDVPECLEPFSCNFSDPDPFYRVKLLYYNVGYHSENNPTLECEHLSVPINYPASEVAKSLIHNSEQFHMGITHNPPIQIIITPPLADQFGDWKKECKQGPPKYIPLDQRPKPEQILPPFYVSIPRSQIIYS